jgi:hypothetical protein
MTQTRGQLYTIIMDDKRYWNIRVTPYLTTEQLEDIVARIQHCTMCGIFMIPGKVTEVYLHSNELVDGHTDYMITKLEECEATEFHIYIECYESLLKVSRDIQDVFDKDETIAYIKAFGMEAAEVYEDKRMVNAAKRIKIMKLDQ